MGPHSLFIYLYFKILWFRKARSFDTLEALPYMTVSDHTRDISSSIAVNKDNNNNNNNDTSY